MAKKFKSDAFEAIHSAVSGIWKVGIVTKETMRYFDETCLTVPEELGPKQIKALRESYHVSQPVFARYLNLSESTVEKWESGATKPQGAALKLLWIVKKTWAGSAHLKQGWLDWRPGQMICDSPSQHCF